MPHKIDLTGQRFHRLTVIEQGPYDTNLLVRWKCRCDCGNETLVRSQALRLGRIKSCGCLPRQNSERVLDPVSGKMVRPPGYGSWTAMKSRCYCKADDSYHKYGAKGITVCDRWLGADGLKNFLTDMGPKPSPHHSVGRKDWRLGYTPENCEWQTSIEQGLYKSNSRMFTHNGKTQCLTAWERELGLAIGSLRLRLKRGWSLHKALSTPRLNRGLASVRHQLPTEAFANHAAAEAPASAPAV